MSDPARLGLFLLAAVVLVAVVRAWARRQGDALADPVIDGLIARRGVARGKTKGKRRRFEGFDPALREQTETRRRSADALHASGHRVATRDRAHLRRVR